MTIEKKFFNLLLPEGGILSEAQLVSRIEMITSSFI